MPPPPPPAPPSSFTLLSILALVFVVCVLRSDGASFPRPGRFIPAGATPANCTNCTRRLLGANMVQQLRLKYIQEQIMAKLRMSETPGRNPTEIPSEVIRKAIEKMKIGETKRRSKMVNPPPDEGREGYYAQISEIISFSEEANHTANDVIKFSVADDVPEGGLAVTSASLWILIRYKKTQKVKNPTKSITIQLHRVGYDGDDDTLLTSLIVSVRHTRWQKVGLPTDIIQTMFESPDHQLFFRINCPNCPRGIEPVLVRKLSRVRRRPARRVNAPRRIAPRRKKRVNKRRPFLVIRTRLKSKPHSAVRRSVSCSRTSNRCCKKSHYVSFKELGWDSWIIAPDGYYANYCNGKCSNYVSPENRLTHHSTVIDGYRKRTSGAVIKSCCSPRKMSALSLLYFDERGNIVKTDLPRMVVEECGCT